MALATPHDNRIQRMRTRLGKRKGPATGLKLRLTRARQRQQNYQDRKLWVWTWGSRI